MSGLPKRKYEGHWYDVEFYDTSDQLYHANVYKDNEYNLYHTTGGFVYPEDAETAAEAVIDFINEYEERR